MEEFKKYYQFPLKEDTYGYNKVWDATGQTNAFDFVLPFITEKPVYDVSEISKENFIKIINGEDIKIKDPNVVFTLEKGVIKLNDTHLLMVRNWGRLIGVGGFNLPREKATQIQDDFANYVLKKLQNSVVK